MSEDKKSGEVSNGFAGLSSLVSDIDASPADDVADEMLALAIEDGIDALAPSERAAVLRAMAGDPALGAVVADLARGRAVTGEWRILGVRREAWRAALAACAILVVGTSMWALLLPAPTKKLRLQRRMRLASPEATSPAFQSLTPTNLSPRRRFATARA